MPFKSTLVLHLFALSLCLTLSCGEQVDVRFVVNNDGVWENWYKRHLAGLAASTNWGEGGMMAQRNQLRMHVKGPSDQLEQDLGVATQYDPLCFSHSNTSNSNSTNHRMALKVETGGVAGNLYSYYMLGDRAHSINNLPDGFSRNVTGKLMLWVRN